METEKLCEKCGFALVEHFSTDAGDFVKVQGAGEVPHEKLVRKVLTSSPFAKLAGLSRK